MTQRRETGSCNAPVKSTEGVLNQMGIEVAVLQEKEADQRMVSAAKLTGEEEGREWREGRTHRARLSRRTSEPVLTHLSPERGQQPCTLSQRRH